MMTDLLQFTDAIAPIFWNYLLHSTISLAMCALAINIVNPSSYAFRAWLWKSASTLPLATSLLVSILSINSFQFGYVIDHKLLDVDSANSEWVHTSSVANLAAAKAEESVSQGLASNPSVDAEFSSAGSIDQTSNSLSSALTLGSPDIHALRRNTTQSFAILLLLLWSSSWTAVKIAHFFACYRKLMRVTSECRSGGLHNELVRFLKSVGIKRPVRLLLSDRVEQPFALGIARWTIVVPRHLEDALGKEQLRALFAHEVGHLVRHDAVWIVIGGFLCSFLSFQPLNFLARRRWVDASEFLADEWAVQNGVAPLNLVRCLSSVAEWRGSRILSSAMQFANKNAHALTRRAEFLLRNKAINQDSTSWHRFSASLALTLAALIFVLFGPHIGKARAREAGPSQSAEGTQLETELQMITNLLRDVSSNLDQVDVNTVALSGVNGLPERVKQLKRRSDLLVDRADGLSKLFRKDLP